MDSRNSSVLCWTTSFVWSSDGNTKGSGSSISWGAPPSTPKISPRKKSATITRHPTRVIDSTGFDRLTQDLCLGCRCWGRDAGEPYSAGTGAAFAMTGGWLFLLEAACYTGVRGQIAEHFRCCRGSRAAYLHANSPCGHMCLTTLPAFGLGQIHRGYARIGGTPTVTVELPALAACSLSGG